MSAQLGLVEVGEAQERILDVARPLPPEPVELDDALGRALSEDVRAVRTLPPWNNSAMDGYAVRVGDLPSLGVRLQVVETVYAGGTPTRALSSGQAARVMTGAPLPQGADAVVMQEKTRYVDPSSVEILEVPSSGQFVREAGEDAREGEVLLARGTALGIPEAALLWAQGLSRVNVPRRPRVALLATGDELCAVGEEPRGRIVDTNTPALAASVRRAGGIPTALGIARDDPEEVYRLFERARGYDVILSSAGVSVGDRDFVKDILARLGAEVRFWRVAIKPGKPLLFATLGATLVFGLPGNPASSLVTFELFVRPALRRLLGLGRCLPEAVSGRVSVDLSKPPGLTHFLRVSVEARDGGALWATPVATQTSGAIRSTVQATHLLVFPKEATSLRAGEEVRLIPCSWAA